MSNSNKCLVSIVSNETRKGIPTMLTYLYCYISSYFQSEEGQGMAEYGLILALVAVVPGR